MNDFDKELSASAADMIGEFAEQITYEPSDGDPRTIPAIVDRNPVGGTDAPPGGHGPNIEIIVVNSADGGISAVDLDTGRDKVSLAVRIGDDPQQRSIKNIVSQDAGLLTLGIR